jgi:hypothetical protein
MSLSNLEKETGINYSDGSSEAIVYTANFSLKKKLDGLCLMYPKDFKHIVLVGDNDGIKSYKIPKKRVCINAPRVYSEKQKKAMSDRAKIMGKTNNS